MLVRGDCRIATLVLRGARESQSGTERLAGRDRAFRASNRTALPA